MKPWLETWASVVADFDQVELHCGEGQVHCIPMGCLRTEQGEFDDDDLRRAKIIAGAPAMVRALLRLEYGGSFTWPNGQTLGACHECHATENEEDHLRFCRVDAALTQSGLPTKASRDAARADIAAMEKANVR